MISFLSPECCSAVSIPRPLRAKRLYRTTGAIKSRGDRLGIQNDIETNRGTHSSGRDESVPESTAPQEHEQARAQTLEHSPRRFPAVSLRPLRLLTIDYPPFRAAGTDVAFATATGQCVDIDSKGKRQELKFRLTMGLRKIDGRWRVMHEHHSRPAV